jgi:hypothetical protein
MFEPRAKFIAPAAHGFVAHHDAALEQQLFKLAQAQPKPEVPVNGTSDKHRWKTITAIERFGIFTSRSTRPRWQRDRVVAAPSKKQVLHFEFEAAIPSGRRDAPRAACVLLATLAN